ncbi:MAG: hypothetical protein CVV61_04105 [Tenericutes bacterium HGW-Tenericutes-6]|jgi:hypothetical protein|nr:MAG: hypothetical protein CVV61_04105 [Tenericutes bacterium HGW-Tenericutes-6]
MLAGDDMEFLKAIEEKRQSLYNGYQKEQKTAFLFVGVGLLLAGIGFIMTQMFLLIPGIILLLVAGAFFGKAQNHARSFRRIVKSEFVTTLLKETFEDVSYDQFSFIPISTINQTQTIKRPDRYHGEDYMKGTYKGVKFELSDIDLKERVETRDSKGNVTVSYQTYFKGRWYIFKFERNFNEVLKIIEGRGYQANTRGLTKIDTEMIEFNKKFAIYSTTQEHAFYLITSSMLEKLMALEKLHRGSILYCFQGNELHIGVNDNRNYLELSIKTPIQEESIKDFIADIDLIPAIINELRLDSQKFKNNSL